MLVTTMQPIDNNCIQMYYIAHATRQHSLYALSRTKQTTLERLLEIIGCSS